MLVMMSVANSDGGVGSEGLGFNLYVAPFLNVCILNLYFELEGISQRWSELGWRGSTRSRTEWNWLERVRR